MEDSTAQQEVAGDLAKPEGLLYHYTTQEGLLGIFKDKCIWATHIRYLNDASEFVHGLTLVRRFIQEVTLDTSSVFTGDNAATSTQRMETVFRDALIGVLDNIDQISVFVASFFDSDRDMIDLSGQDSGDVLEQWRAYSGAQRDSA